MIQIPAFPKLEHSVNRVCYNMYSFLNSNYPHFEFHIYLQLVRRLQSQDRDESGEEVPAIRDIFMIVHQVSFSYSTYELHTKD